MAKNVYGTELVVCSTDPMTGFFRTGVCDTCGDDAGMHTVCAEVTDEFLEFSKAAGNDLSTPRPEYRFPGLKDGDRWCICLPRWIEALEAGVAPKLLLKATHMSAIEHIPKALLLQYALDPDDAPDDFRLVLVDAEAALEGVDGDYELLQAVTDAFVDESPGLLMAAETAIKDNDSAALARAGHTLKGALISLGADPAAEVARRLEELSTDADISEQTTELVRALQQMIPIVLQQLQQICNDNLDCD